MVSVSGRDDGMRNETVANVALFRERERSSLVGARRPVVPVVPDSDLGALFR